MTQTKPTVEGLNVTAEDVVTWFEGQSTFCLSKRRTRAATFYSRFAGIVRSLASDRDRLEAEGVRLREALVLVNKLSQKPEGNLPGLNLDTCGVIARAALNPQAGEAP